ncbi:glycosyltransferase family 25 protein [Conservatibacter flavescens]|uniref:Lsg locus protein 4 n=1 Tax=Conservatibacter flavescens TaxID=28161 RepID=A0A2M8S266_9PAST|nr:glycosyltransferase family 25 protein [Conservatibacter flavescens]PJG85225.1 Lsg locus protein 4 [Conservatibacter flavescens]
MKKFLVSLDKDVARRELFFAQPDTQNFEVFSAINTMNETEETLAQRFDLTQFEQHYGRKVTKGEVGCTLSHLAIYQKIADNSAIAEDEFCLICEDDALFAENFQSVIDEIIQQNIQADIILTGQSKILQFNDIELEINYPITFEVLSPKIGNTNYCYAFPYKNYFAGTVCYLIKKSAVRKFLIFLTQHKAYWLADDYPLFEQQFAMQTRVIRPLLAIENPDLVSNLESIRGSLNNNLFKKLVKYPLKKALAIKRNLT